MQPRTASQTPDTLNSVSCRNRQTSRRILLVSLLAAVGLALPGCQTNSPGGSSGAPKAISLEEAKAITAQFKTTSYVPPNRSIDDIRRVLRSPRKQPADCTAVQSERRYELNIVLGSVGDTSMRAEGKADSVRGIVDREMQRGQFKDMESLLEEAIEKTSRGEEEWDRYYATSHATFRILLSQIHLATGDTEQALKMLDLAEQELNSTYSSRDNALRSARKNSARQALTPLVLAYRNQIEGNHEIAEANLRTAVNNRFHLGYNISLSVRPEMS